MGGGEPYAPVYQYDPIEWLADDVFMVRGSVSLNALMHITRNMAIVRHGGELTLIDPVRLDAAAEARLRQFGNVQHVLRLGSFHNLDDSYDVDTFKAPFWSQAGGTAHTSTRSTMCLNRPLSRRIRSHVDEKNPTPFVVEYDEDVEQGTAVPMLLEQDQ